LKGLLVSLKSSVGASLSFFFAAEEEEEEAEERASVPKPAESFQGEAESLPMPPLVLESPPKLNRLLAEEEVDVPSAVAEESD